MRRDMKPQLVGCTFKARLAAPSEISNNWEIDRCVWSHVQG